MSIIDYVTISITRTSLPEGSICSIDYSYFINTDTMAYLNNTHFDVSVELCGEDLLRNKDLGEKIYDRHRVASHDPMPVKRSFLVPCGVLNEAVGKDAIFIRLWVTAENGTTFNARSPTVHDYF